MGPRHVQDHARHFPPPCPHSCGTCPLQNLLLLQALDPSCPWSGDVECSGVLAKGSLAEVST